MRDKSRFPSGVQAARPIITVGPAYRANQKDEECEYERVHVLGHLIGLSRRKAPRSYRDKRVFPGQNRLDGFTK